jgi:hypothetical protein
MPPLSAVRRVFGQGENKLACIQPTCAGPFRSRLSARQHNGQDDINAHTNPDYLMIKNAPSPGGVSAAILILNTGRVMPIGAHTILNQAY